MGSYAICTRRLDPNALLRLRIFSEKWAPTDLGPFWDQFSFPNGDCYVKKGVPTIASKRCPARVKQDPIRMPGGSRTGSLAGALFRQETVVRAAVEALFEILAEKSELDSKLVGTSNGLLNNVAKTLFHVVSIAVFVEVSFERMKR